MILKTGSKNLNFRRWKYSISLLLTCFDNIYIILALFCWWKWLTKQNRDRNEKLEGEKEDALIHSKWRKRIRGFAWCGLIYPAQLHSIVTKTALTVCFVWPFLVPARPGCTSKKENNRYVYLPEFIFLIMHGIIMQLQPVLCFQHHVYTLSS